MLLCNAWCSEGSAGGRPCLDQALCLLCVNQRAETTAISLESEQHLGGLKCEAIQADTQEYDLEIG